MELVGVNDTLGYILWARYFMEEQGYDMDPFVLYQENMSAILLETNGKVSSTKRTKHIKVKYFYIKENVDSSKILLKHCPTGQMWMDINTKPKQGTIHLKFWGYVMGIPADYKYKDYAGVILSIPPVSLMLPVPKALKASQECVGGTQKLIYDRPLKVTSTDVDGRPKLLEQVPIKIVDGRPWSPGVYRALRLLGSTLEVAWERAFVRTSHF